MPRILFILIIFTFPITLFAQTKKNKIFIPNFEVSNSLGKPIQKKAMGDSG